MLFFLIQSLVTVSTFPIGILLSFIRGTEFPAQTFRSPFPQIFFFHTGNQITEWLKNCFPDMYMFKIAYLIVNVNSQNTQISFTYYVPYIISFLSHLYSCISNDIPSRPWKRLFFWSINRLHKSVHIQFLPLPVLSSSALHSVSFIFIINYMLILKNTA